MTQPAISDLRRLSIGALAADLERDADDHPEEGWDAVRLLLVRFFEDVPVFLLLFFALTGHRPPFFTYFEIVRTIRSFRCLIFLHLHDKSRNNRYQSCC